MYEKALCALTEEVMKNPVEVNGEVYEQEAIIKHLKDSMDMDPFGMQVNKMDKQWMVPAEKEIQDICALLAKKDKREEEKEDDEEIK